jgi:hypothetical protein
MNLKELATHLANHEGLKHEITIGDAREIVGILSDLMVDGDHVALMQTLIANGKRRAKRKKK